MDLTVNGGLSLFMLVFMNAFLLDRRIDLLVDGGVMFSGLVPGVMTSISCCSRERMEDWMCELMQTLT